MIRHSETAKMSKTLCFFILGGQLAGSGGRTLFSDSLKLQLYQHRDQLILLKVEVYLKPPHLNIALWAVLELKGFLGVFEYSRPLHPPLKPFIKYWDTLIRSNFPVLNALPFPSQYFSNLKASQC